MGEGVFGFDLSQGIGGTGFGGVGFGLPDPFLPSSGRTAVRCDLTDRDIANVEQSAGLAGLYNYAQVQARYGGFSGACDVRAKLAARIAALGGDVGFLDTLNGIGTTIGNAITTAGNVIGTIATAAGSIASVINGGSAPVQGPVWTMAPAMQAPMNSMVNGNTGQSGQAAFEMACRADPACTAAVVQALQMGAGGMGMMNGGVSDAMVDAQLAALGFPPALVQLVKATPGLIGRLLPAVGSVVGGAALGAGITALTTPGMGMRLPRRIQVPDGKGGVREYVSRGRPILYSGDLTAARRVVKVAGRARRGRARRSSAKQPMIMIGSGPVKNVCSKCLEAPCGC